MKIVFLTSRFPYPLEKGDKLRAYHQIKSLALEHEVHLLSITDLTLPKSYFEKIYEITPHIHVVQMSPWERYNSLLKCLIHQRPFQIGWFYSPSAASLLGSIIDKINPDHIICQLPRMAEYVRYSKFPKTLDYMDSFGIGMMRRAQVAGMWTSWLYKLEAQRMLTYEEELSTDFDHLTIISEQDKNSFKFEQKNNMVVIPNGIDHNYFQFNAGIKKEYDIIFIGNMGYLPNIEAAEYIVHQILPLCPQTFKVCISGATPAPRVAKLQSIQVTIQGWVEDIRGAYSKGKIFVTPMWSGTGQQNKILEAMAMGIPCITTSLVNNAIGAKPNEEILLAETKEEFASHIMALKNNPQLYLKLQSNAIKFVKEHFSWEQSTLKLSSIIQYKH